MEPVGKTRSELQNDVRRPARRRGASYAWAGNNKVGAGRSTITESRLNELVRLRLEFLKPMTATNTAEFTFQPDGGQTAVTWAMSGKTRVAARSSGCS